MPILSEAGDDRFEYLNRARNYTLEFDSVGAKAVSAVPANKRNIKINLVTEAFFHPKDPLYNLNDSEHYGQASRSLSPTIKKILDIMKLPDTRETFGLTYRDLLEMDDVTLTYVHETVFKMYEQRVEAQRKQEKELNNGK